MLVNSVNLFSVCFSQRYSGFSEYFSLLSLVLLISLWTCNFTWLLFNKVWNLDELHYGADGWLWFWYAKQISRNKEHFCSAFVELCFCVMHGQEEVSAGFEKCFFMYVDEKYYYVDLRELLRNRTACQI